MQAKKTLPCIPYISLKCSPSSVSGRDVLYRTVCFTIRGHCACDVRRDHPRSFNYARLIKSKRQSEFDGPDVWRMLCMERKGDEKDQHANPRQIFSESETKESTSCG